MPQQPQYPVYVPSKQRVGVNLTIKRLVEDGVPHRIVVEPQEHDAYAARWGADRLLVLPENNRGLIYARNWIRDHAVTEGFKRHWQIDDNISKFLRWHTGKRRWVNAGIALRVVEDFADRYENVAIAGLNYDTFAQYPRVPFVLNAHVYSCTLVLNSIPYRFRPPANEDVDMCLQVLAGGWCTVQVNAFLIQKRRTMTVKGGQTDSAYRGDGRLFMARALERVWPGVVSTDRRFQRPQHVVAFGWRKFDTQLIPRADIDLASLPPVDEYGMELRAVAK